ncbi:DUF4129 domain-containing protein [Micromonospora sp. KC723]|nr:DUF4129 domain-containing protein [Micromonospora sp. KC723]
MLLLLVAGLVALAWYHFPAWLPRRLPRLRLPRLRLPRLRLPRLRLPRLRLPRLRLPRLRLPRLRLPRLRRPRSERRPRRAVDEAPRLPRPRVGEEPPGLPLADRLAAEGRFAEAVRERLRGMVRRLVAAGVVAQRPGLTVTEVTEEASRNLPPVDPPLRAAAALFSTLWYAHRPASAEHDRRMRELADELDRVLAGRGEPR